MANSDMARLRATLREAKAVNKNIRSWPSIEPQFKALTERMQSMGYVRSSTAFSYYLGGMMATLKMDGSISRERGLRLLEDAVKFGESIK